ncbi:MAG TPA: hypothetical protein VND24_07700 [Steroidobacteraceae bacterium]|nr:hypothetical protein [Steroidobacteraceae bacterium]
MKRSLAEVFSVALALAAALVRLAGGSAAMAVDRLVLTVGRVASPVAALDGVRLSLDLARGGGTAATGAKDSGERPRIEARIARVQVRRPGVPALDDLRLSCGSVALGPPDFACRDGQLAARVSALGPLSAAMSASFEPGSHTWKVDATGVPLAAGRARLAGVLRPGGWSLEVRAAGVDLERAARIARLWASLPAGYALSGHADVQVEVDDRSALTLTVGAQSADLDLTNGPGTVVAQRVAASLSGTLVRRNGRLALEASMRGSSGQALAGPVLLDFGANPLTLDARLQRSGNGPIIVSRLALEQRNLVRAQAWGVLQPDPHPEISSGHLRIASLRFPAAYTSYLQLALATTELGSLQTSGTAVGAIDIVDDAITRLDCSLHDVNFADPGTRLLMQHASGDIHWAAAPGAALAQSEVSWKRAAADGLSGGPVRLRFAAWQHNFALLGGNTRLPVLDGAVIVHTLVGRDLGTPGAQVDFDADVTPISMPRLSKAFGWPAMSGEVSGHVPLVRYRHRDLTFDGDLVARVFDGTITGSDIVLKNPLGPFPRLSANVLARGLDLDLVTHTFAFGSMTGRVDADVRGLQLFDWSPVAFDARLYTMPGDRSPHRISQNAVTRIAGLGGAAGAVTAALESGVLRFFHTFHYGRIGIGCRLRNEVCTMSGVTPAPDGGYYLVKGSGLPRLDIIGNVHRVDWPRLVGQVAQGMREHDVVVNAGGK